MKAFAKWFNKTIEEKHISRYQIHKDTGISAKCLSRIALEGEDPRVDTIEILAEYLGYRIVLEPIEK